MWLRRAVCAALLVVLVACDRGGEPAGVPVRSPAASPTAPSGPVIALVGTMSGRGMWRGEDAFEGADLGVHLLNQSNRGGALPFQLVTVDDRGDPRRATELVEELAEDPRTVGIVYAGPTEGIVPAAEALSTAGIPAVVCYGDLHGAGLLRSHLFQVAPPLPWQARRHAAYIARDRRYRRVGLLSQRGRDGDTAVAATRSAVRRAGLSRPMVRRFATDDDLGPLLTDMKRRRVEALLVHGPPAAIRDVAALQRQRGSTYRTTARARTVTAPRRIRVRERRGSRRPWRPQLMGFDLAIAPTGGRLPPGTTASDTYARGGYMLPIPSLTRFREAFANWWETDPVGWERRAFEAASMIGWAARRTMPEEDVAQTLEGLGRRRFGGLDVRFGPDGHTSVEERTVGLWVVPRGGIRLPEAERRPPEMPWAMLGRGFSRNGRRTAVLARDWSHLFRDPPPRGGRAPRIGTARFGVTTPRRDPVH